MATSVPAYTNVCIAPDNTGSAVWLVGVPSSNEGRLEAYSVNISNINTPNATLIATQTNTLYWSSQLQRACFSYPGNSVNANSPVLMQQFGSKSYFTNIYPNGTADFATNFASVGVVSPKLFSLSGAVGDLDWFTAVANVSSATTNSAWTGLRMNGTAAVNSDRDFIISQYPTAAPLISVGAYIATSNTPAQGYHIVFDTTGSGVMYTTLDTAAPILTATDRILSLASPQTIDMGGIKLTGNAIPITMAGVAYILDKASDGSTVLYSLNPSQGAKLQRVSIQSDVPPFSVNIAAAAVSSKIVIYGASNNGIATATFNAFDTVAGVWTGPGLVKAMTVTSPSGSSPSNGSDGSGGKSGKSSIGGIVGGVVGGLVVVALIAFLFIRHRRNNKKGSTSSAAAGAGSAGVETVAVPRPNIVYDGKHDNYPQAASPPMQQNYISGVPPQFQQQQQQQQYNAHHSYIPQSFSMDPSKDAYIAASPHQLQPQQNPMIFQAQQQPMYSYAPPILTTVPQPHQPQIFQPQNDAASDPSYSHAIYTSSASGSTPHTPYTPANQVHTPSTATASSPQYMPSSNQGYVS